MDSESLILRELEAIIAHKFADKRVIHFLKDNYCMTTMSSLSSLPITDVTEAFLKLPSRAWQYLLFLFSWQLQIPQN